MSPINVKTFITHFVFLMSTVLSPLSAFDIENLPVQSEAIWDLRYIEFFSQQSFWVR